MDYCVHNRVCPLVHRLVHWKVYFIQCSLPRNICHIVEVFILTSPPTHRGATVEKCVEFLTESISHLWGGFSLKSGPRSPGNELMKRATKQQIMTFFLTSYQSFMHPLIFIRLLLHRLATPCSQNPFDWSVNSDKCSVPSFPHVDTMPPHQTATLNVIGRWLEDHPDDFITYPQLNVRLSIMSSQPAELTTCDSSQSAELPQ